MLPVLYRFTFESDASRAVLYLVALALVAMSARNGWRTATGATVNGQPTPPTPEDRRNQTIQYGVLGAVMAVVGLYFILPSVPILGAGRGLGIPIHTYGILVGSGFICAITVSAWLAAREWPGEVGAKRREQVMDIAFYLFVGAIIGSRELFILVNWKSYVGDKAKIAEGYSVVVDVIALVALVVAVAYRERLISNAAARATLVQKAFRYFLTVAVASRVVFSFVVGDGPKSLLALVDGGLVFYGGLIGASVTALWYCLANGIEFLRLADLAMPTVSLGQALGRLGCFSAGCCWGDVTTHERAPFAVEFPGTGLVKDLFGGLGPTPSLAFSSQVDRIHETRWVIEKTGEVSSQMLPGSELITDWVSRHGHTLPVHPTQLYESIGQTLLFVLLLTARRYRRFHGQIFAMWLIAYAFLRSSVEMFRGDLERGTLRGLLLDYLPSLAAAVPVRAWYNLSTSQFISLVMLSLGSWLLITNLRQVASKQPVDLAALGVSQAP